MLPITNYHLPLPTHHMLQLANLFMPTSVPSILAYKLQPGYPHCRVVGEGFQIQHLAQKSADVPSTSGNYTHTSWIIIVLHLLDDLVLLEYLWTCRSSRLESISYAVGNIFNFRYLLQLSSHQFFKPR